MFWKKNNSRKGQAWIFDMIISIVLFSAAILIAFSIIRNSFSTDTGFQSAREDASRISEFLISEGVPSDWSPENVVRPGFFTGRRLNSSKIILGMNLTNSSYESTKPLFQTSNDYLVFFENSTGEIIPFENFCSFGKTGILEINMTPETVCSQPDFSGENYENIVAVTRYVLHDYSIAKMKIYVWD